MEILWISGRKIGFDLADTTETGLIDSINNTGNNVFLISPGRKDDLGNNHLSVKTIELPGLITISGSIDIKRKIKKVIKNRKFDIIIIDWRYVSLLRKTLKSTMIPWLMIDRGPPAKQNWKLRFQKIMWNKAWQITQKNAINGIVVSDMHNDFIKRYANVNMDNIIVNSGSSQSKGKIKKIDENTILEVVYVGQIDKRRDIISILKFKSELDRNHIKNNIRIVGEGDYCNALKKEIRSMDKIKLIGKKNKKEIREILDSSHVGVLPMPKTPIWEIASPIKLVEYARFGLITVGPKHSGNKWINYQEDLKCWEFLSDSESWWIEAAEKIKETITKNKWKKYSESAIVDSEIRTWDLISQKMIQEIENQINDI